ncbi:uncharacterized protein [Dermacentor albipictus]|uniref:uncharacterized protein n=1 Tax=Dermacentor albipictus TaxID=60249 RepID=UPI0038FD0831
MITAVVCHVLLPPLQMAYIAGPTEHAPSLCRYPNQIDISPTLPLLKKPRPPLGYWTLQPAWDHTLKVTLSSPSTIKEQQPSRLPCGLGGCATTVSRNMLAFTMQALPVFLVAGPSALVVSRPVHIDEPQSGDHAFTDDYWAVQQCLCNDAQVSIPVCLDHHFFMAAATSATLSTSTALNSSCFHDYSIGHGGIRMNMWLTNPFVFMLQLQQDKELKARADHFSSGGRMCGRTPKWQLRQSIKLHKYCHIFGSAIKGATPSSNTGGGASFLLYILVDPPKEANESNQMDTVSPRCWRKQLSGAPYRHTNRAFPLRPLPINNAVYKPVQGPHAN